MPSAFLPDRGIVKIGGDEARGFLQGLVTCDMGKVTPEVARYGALLTPQGKIIVDFILAEAPADAGGGFYLDCPRALAPDLAKRLLFYRLRARVTVEDLSATLGVAVAWGDAARPDDDTGLVLADPRIAALGWRVIAARPDAEDFGADGAAYRTHRILLGVPEGGHDFIYGDAFPHEVDMDQLAGVDFDKGCYVGQEVVSRMEHRGTARTRIVGVVFPDGVVPLDGLDVVAGARVLGSLGSCAAGHGRGIARLRLDRVADALAAGEPIMAGGLAVVVEKPAWARFAMPAAASPPAAIKA